MPRPFCVVGAMGPYEGGHLLLCFKQRTTTQPITEVRHGLLLFVDLLLSKADA